MSRYIPAARSRPRDVRSRRLASVVTLMVFVVIVAVIAAIEGLVAAGSASGWFRFSAQVVWTPPKELSRGIWAVVFLLLAIGGWLVWRRTPVATAPRARTL